MGGGNVLRTLLAEDLNFLVTNRIPRRLATQAAGWFSRLPTGPFTGASIAVWRLFAPDLDLSEARQQRFRSLRDCFTRELKPGARPVDPDPDVLTSPCDAIVGAHGPIRGTEVFQAKGYPYRLEELFGDPDVADRHRDGTFVTLRLKSSFYHRFHAPCAGRLERVTYVSGDTWNVNPIALRRVERLFCRNERAVLELVLPDRGPAVTLVAVAAILVATIRIHALGKAFDLRSGGPTRIPCDATFEKGDELGWFENGSTILIFASPGIELCTGITEGTLVRVGQPLLEHPCARPENVERTEEP
jgi:phosphatidylserine decarboxylase